MSKLRMPPLGVDDFEKLRRRNSYYVDKTGLLKELLENQADVTLFTRPRRFGKTLNMSMLQSRDRRLVPGYFREVVHE